VDGIPRGGRVLLIAGAIAAGACGGDRGALSGIGVSTPRAAQSVARADGGAPGVSPVPQDFRARMVRATDRFLSRGHAERFDGVVWTNDVARVAWDQAGDMPEGSLLVEEAIERGGREARGDRAAGLLVMEKKPAGWRFVAIDPKGNVVDDAARTAACAACHRDAPRDWVFRVPGIAAPAPVGSPTST
jgi:hypothetical protein